MITGSCASAVKGPSLVRMLLRLVWRSGLRVGYRLGTAGRTMNAVSAYLTTEMSASRSRNGYVRDLREQSNSCQSWTQVYCLRRSETSPKCILLGASVARELPRPLASLFPRSLLLAGLKLRAGLKLPAGLEFCAWLELRAWLDLREVTADACLC